MKLFGNLPWRQFKWAFRSIRRDIFPGDRPTGRYFVVDLNDGGPDVYSALGDVYFQPNWMLSYYYRGEHLNLARGRHYAVEGSDYIWWQFHVRGWIHDDYTLWLNCHWELSPTEYPKEHINGEGIDVERGMEVLERILNDTGFDYTERMYERK